MRRRVVIWSATLAVAAATLTATAPAASAAVAECPSLPASTSVGTVTGTVTGPSGDERAAVYVIDAESGAMTCAVTAADGSYSASLPGVGTGEDARMPSDAWFIIANPSSTSSLGSASRLLISDLVTPGSTVSSQDLTLTASDLTVLAYEAGSSTPAAQPTTVCLIGTESVVPTTCGVTQERGGAWSATLTVPSSGSYVVDAYLMDAEGWLEGTGSGDPISKGDGVSMVEVVLEAESLLACPAGTTAISGTVTRIGTQGAVPARANVEAIARQGAEDYDWRFIGWTTSQRDGSYRLCISEDELPPGVTLEDVDVTLRTERLTGGITVLTDWNQSDTIIDVEIPAVAPVGGAIEYGDGSPGASVTWNISPIIQDGDGTYTGPDVAYGRTDFTGSWGVTDLPNGEYILRAYPTTPGFAMVEQEFTIADGSASVNATFPRGNLLGQAVLEDGSPNSYAWVGAFDPTTCGENGCDEFGASTDAQGFFTLSLPDGNYIVRVRAGWDISGIVTTEARVAIVEGVASCIDGCEIVDGVATIIMGTPNAAFRILAEQGGGESVPAPDAYLSLESFDTEAGQNEWPWRQMGGDPANDEGLVSLSLTESGVYRFYVFPPWGMSAPRSITHVQATVTEGEVSLELCPTPENPETNPCTSGRVPFPLTDGAWDLLIPLPNLTATATSPAGDPVSEAGYDLQRIVASGQNTMSYWVDGGIASRAGEIALNLEVDGVYRLSLRLPDGVQEDWVGSSYYFTRTDEGVCLMDSPSTECAPEGAWAGDLAFGTPNVSGVILGAGGAPLGNTWLDVSQPCDWYDGCTQPYSENPGTFVGSSGVFQLNLPDDDTYILTVHPWQATDGSVRTSFTLPIAAGQTFTGDDSLTLQLRAANVTGTVTIADGTTPAEGSWVNVERFMDFGDGFGYWQGTDAGGSVNEQGAYGVALDAGTYRLRVEPGPQWRTVAVATIDDSFTISSSSQTVSRDIELAEPNIRGTVLLPEGDGAANAWVEARGWDPTYSQYTWDGSTAGANTDENGDYALNLPDGRWELVANPPWGSSGASRSSLTIIVSSNGTVVATDPTGTGTPGASLDPSDLNLQLATPNVTGSVLTPNDESVSDTWVDIQRWDADFEQYRWAPDLQGVPVSFLGTFATNLPDGQYKLTGNPRYGDAEFSKGSIEIEISSSQACLVGSNPCTPPPDGFVIRLANPNISGSVFATEGMSDPVRFSSVGVERWEGSYWQWVDVWANTSASGAFSMNLTEPGAHRLVAYPSSEYPESTRGVSFVYVAGDGVCQLDSEMDAMQASGCPIDAPASEQLDLRMQLGSANLLGTVTVDGGGTARDSWVEAFIDAGYGLQWVEGSNTNSQGRFAMSLEPDEMPQRYQLRVNPPWQNDQGLARTNVTVWAYPSEDGGVAICEDSEWNQINETCSAPVSSDNLLEVQLAGGNLRGMIVDPDSQQGVANTSANVERWTEAPWAPGTGTYVWQGSDLYANASSQGTFSLNFEDTGVYRINAQPPWSGDGSLASGSAIVRVDAEPDGLRWCSVDDSTGTGSDPFGDCTSPVSDDNSQLAVALRLPNVSVDVVDGSGEGVPGAWVSVRKQVTEGSFTYWQWLGGDGTRRGGTFSTVIDDSATYSLEVYPPWDGDGSLTRFTEEFTVSCVGGTCTPSGLPPTIGFPTPNLQGAVASSTDSDILVPNSWVSVEQWDEAAGNYVWVDQGTSTNRQGRFSMNLSEDDTYRLTANPSWEDPEGVRTSAIVLVSGGDATCVEGCLADNVIQLRAPNVTGTVTDGEIPMAYSWIEVRDASNNWVTGTSTDAQGDYALALEPGDYTLVAFPDWNLSTKPPRAVDITVAGSGPQVEDIDLSAVTPNVTMCINMSGVNSSRAVIVERKDGSTYTLLPEYTSRTEAGSGSCPAQQASWFLPDGTYRFTVLPEIDETFTPSGSNVSADVVISGGVASGDTGIPATP